MGTKNNGGEVRESIVYDITKLPVCVQDSSTCGSYVVYIGNDRLNNKYLYKFTSKKNTVVRIDNGKTWSYGGAATFTSLYDIIDKWGVESLEYILTEKALGYLKKNKPELFAQRTKHEINTESKMTTTFDNVLNAKPEINTESKMTTTFNNVLNANSEAANAAAKITTGKTLNKVILDKLKPSLPMMARGYADSVLAPVIVANLANFVVSNFAKENEKAVWATDAMMVAAMTSFMETFNIENLLAEVLSTVDVSKEA